MTIDDNKIVQKLPLEGFHAVLYARVSTDDKGQTVETQIHEMKSWCKNNKVIIDGIYSDEMTGTTLQRPQFAQAILRIITPPYSIQLLLAYDPSRLTRDEKLEDIANMIAPSKCQIRFSSIDIDPSTFAGKMVNSVISKVDKRENDIRGEKTSIAMLYKRDVEGKHIGRPRQFRIIEDPTALREGEVTTATKYLNIDTILSFVKQGMPTTEIARVFGIGNVATLRRAIKQAGYWGEYQKLKHSEKCGENDATKGCSDIRSENDGKSSDIRVGSE